jgi:CheY-like chemotaxis protein
VVVDDEPAIREIFTDVLTSEGYEVATARNGLEAIQLLQREPADLVLMDVMMPIMDGIAACKLIKSDDQTRNIPVILMSAAANIHSHLDESLPIAGAVHKPLEFDYLLDMVRRFVA